MQDYDVQNVPENLKTSTTLGLNMNWVIVEISCGTDKNDCQPCTVTQTLTIGEVNPTLRREMAKLHNLDIADVDKGRTIIDGIPPKKCIGNRLTTIDAPGGFIAGRGTLLFHTVFTSSSPSCEIQTCEVHWELRFTDETLRKANPALFPEPSSATAKRILCYRSDGSKIVFLDTPWDPANIPNPPRRR